MHTNCLIPAGYGRPALVSRLAVHVMSVKAHHADFFAKSEDMFAEMKWQKKLRSNPALFWVSSHMSFWSYIIFMCTVFINVIVAIPHGLGWSGLGSDFPLLEGNPKWATISLVCLRRHGFWR